MLTLKVEARAVSSSEDMVGKVPEKVARLAAPMVLSMSVFSAVTLAAPVLSRVMPWVTVSPKLTLASGAKKSVYTMPLTWLAPCIVKVVASLVLTNMGAAKVTLNVAAVM